MSSFPKYIPRGRENLHVKFQGGTELINNHISRQEAWSIFLGDFLNATDYSNAGTWV